MNYCFYAEGLNKEFWVKEDSQKKAKNKLWESLTEYEKNKVIQIECIDENNDPE